MRPRISLPSLAGAFTRLLADARTQDCYFCGAASASPLCAPCHAALPRLPAARCPCCALPAPEGLRCGRCLSEKPHYDATIAALAYAYPLDAAIQAFKYQGKLGLTATFADLLDRALGQAWDELPVDGLDGAPSRTLSQTQSDESAEGAPASAHGDAPLTPLGAIDLIIPAPLAPRRLAERGYNQAHELARALARRRHLPLDPQAVTRPRHAPPQAELPWKERAKNIRGAYTSTRRFDGLSVLVVDDVMTTGSTLGELAKVLKKAGAARVTNLVLARTLPAVMTAVKV